MRRLAVLLLVALPLFGYEIRSPRYALVVDVANDHYAVKVTDLVTKSEVASGSLKRSADLVSATLDGGDNRELRVSVVEKRRMLTAEMRVERGDAVLDVLHATWLTEPYTMPAAGSAPLRVGGDVKAPEVIKRVEPVYSAEARAAGISGIVIVEVIIDRNGRVTDAKVLKPLPFGLDQAALDAVRQWEFRPATLNGDAVDVIFNLVLNFKLE